MATAGSSSFRPTAKCELEPVNRWALGLVISIAVLGICLWGTLMGCLIPLILQKIGWDPAVASGALVATFVDVTGIAIFFGQRVADSVLTPLLHAIRVSRIQYPFPAIE